MLGYLPHKFLLKNLFLHCVQELVVPEYCQDLEKGGAWGPRAGGISACAPYVVALGDSEPPIYGVVT